MTILSLVLTEIDGEKVWHNVSSFLKVGFVATFVSDL